MLTPAVLARVGRPGTADNPVCVVWRRTLGGWDYFCRSPLFDIERIVWMDQRDTGLSNEDYKVTRG